MTTLNKRINLFFNKEPTTKGLKSIEGFYSITVPKNYLYIGELSELCFFEKHNVIIRFKKERIHINVIKISE